MKRITPEMVKEAYEKTGVKPSRGCFVWFDDKMPCGCAMGALAMADLGVPLRFDDVVELQKIIDWRMQYGDYGWDFILGFDGNEQFRGYGTDGYSDGLAAAKAVFGD